ncbi:MAG: hypothetical protein P4L55_19520 [Syntrophobacteraceae bacterium]|nr:hypothetical protein [Syntrophobacteraceae bacterium]
MDLYNELNLVQVRSEPDVWVNRIVILERITPKPVFIRNIALTCGLNIIWAEDAEDGNSEPNITGHSAGKTTFCRLFRYILGERTFGTKGSIELIRKAFPEGYVAAEIHVRGRKWAVRRPFGNGRMSYIEEDATIEELLELGGRKANQALYPKEIGLEGLPDELATGEVVGKGESIRWSHVLAWCTRDQESRFQNIHSWRSPRSEAGTPSLGSPKAGPLFIMRAVLGLFLPDELKAEEGLSELEGDRDKVRKEIEEKRREPQFRVNHYEEQLRRCLKSVLPDEPDIDSRHFRSGNLFTKDLERLTVKARNALHELISKGERERQTLQTRIDELGAEAKRLKNELDEQEKHFALGDAAGQEFCAGLSGADEQLKKIEEIKNSKCILGDIFFRECSHIKSRKGILQITEVLDARAMKEAEAARAKLLEKITVQKASLQNEIDLITAEKLKALKRREALAAHIPEQQGLKRDLEASYKELVTWINRRDKPGSYEELDRLKGKLNSVEQNISKIEKQLGAAIRQHNQDLKRLTGIFSKAVRSVLLSEQYGGKVSLENRELDFRITHGPNMSGEAVDTLSVLLADVCSLIYNTVSQKCHLPGFLLHDSPREADLGIGIYKSFIRFVASIQEHFGGAQSCPFQYLITTTTAPPTELRNDKYLKLLLNASTPEGLLLGRNIGAEIPQQRSIF